MPLHVVERPPLEDGPAQGALVVMVHGSMDRGSSFRRLSARLPDWTVVTYDRRGYAGSTSVRPSPVFGHQVDDLLEVLAGRVAVGVGHSLGGDVVLAAIARRPDLIDTAVVFEPPQPWQPSWAAHSAGAAALDAEGDNSPEAAAERFMRRMIGDSAWARLPAATRQRRRAEGNALIADLRSLRHADPPFDAGAIEVPVVLGYGSESRPHHQEGTRLLADQLPQGELALIEGTAHGAHLARPNEFAHLIRRALARRKD